MDKIIHNKKTKTIVMPYIESVLNIFAFMMCNTSSTAVMSRQSLMRGDRFLHLMQ